MRGAHNLTALKSIAGGGPWIRQVSEKKASNESPRRQVLRERGDLLGEGACHFVLGEAYAGLRRPGRAHAAFAACRLLREQAAANGGGGSSPVAGLAAALCREGVSAYGCGDLPAAAQVRKD
jgi:hypothetical protein